MRIDLGSRGIRTALAAALTAVALVVLAACGGSDKSSSSSSSSSSASTSTASSEPAVAASKCGLGNGQKASGTPIKLGGIATKQPGTDFTDIPNTAKA